MKAGGGGGFGGRGFKFDETEANIASDRKKVQAAAMGITHDGGEDSAAADVSVLQTVTRYTKNLNMCGYHFSHPTAVI